MRREAIWTAHSCHDTRDVFSQYSSPIAIYIMCLTVNWTGMIFVEIRWGMVLKVQYTCLLRYYYWLVSLGKRDDNFQFPCFKSKAVISSVNSLFCPSVELTSPKSSHHVGGDSQLQVAGYFVCCSSKKQIFVASCQLFTCPILFDIFSQVWTSVIFLCSYYKLLSPRRLLYNTGAGLCDPWTFTANENALRFVISSPSRDYEAHVGENVSPCLVPLGLNTNALLWAEEAILWLNECIINLVRQILFLMY